MIIINCKINKPYPKIQVEKPNTYYANLLLNDYAGINSELTSITQYIFQNFNFFKDYPEMSNTLRDIAVVEMQHLSILGQTIKLLGIRPDFRFPSKPNYTTYWNSTYVNYSICIPTMLKDDIILEQVAINNYQKDINIINDKYIKRILARIIEDEELHIKCFKELLNKYNNKAL